MKLKNKRAHCVHSLFPMGKRGVSEVIAYVLLIGISITIAVVAYGYLEGFVPKNTIDCPDGISLAIKNINNSEGQSFNVTLQNNGRFNVDGYFIKIANNSASFLADIDLSKYLIQDGSGSQGGGIVNFPGGNLGIEKEIQQKFNSTNATAPKQVCLVEITPIAYLKNSEGRNTIAVCTNAKIKQEVLCGDQLWECKTDSDCSSSGGVCDSAHKCANPVIWLEFNGDYTDSSDNGNTGVPSGGVTFVPDSYPLGSGKPQTVLNLDGIDDYVRVPTADDGSLRFGKNSFTVTAWMKTSLSTSNRGAFGNGYYDWGPGFGMYSLGFCITQGSSVHYSGMPAPLQACSYTSEWRDGSWKHFAFVVDRSNPNNVDVTSYINGVGGTFWYSTPQNQIDLTATDKDLLVGALYSAYGTGSIGFNFQGKIDDFRIYPSVLNSSQIQSIMTS
ncbi:MAG: LamG domain-containing protein [Nanoarchaeota archaeon]|nr:LamG domain-containing protein [Nanoarchaeota archaeon]